MLKVIFCHDGHHVADAHVLEYVDSVFYEYEFGGRADMEARVGNELIVDGFVLRLLDGGFPEEEIEFYENDIKLGYDCRRGLAISDPENSMMGTHAEITRKIFQHICSNIKAHSLEGEG